MYKFRDGFYADVRIEDKYTTSIAIKDDVLQECKETTLKKAFIRVYDGKMWYYASTSDIGSIQESLDSLYKYGNPDSTINDNPVVKRYEVNKEELFRFEDRCVKAVSLKDKRKLAAKLSKMLDTSQYIKLRYAIYTDRYSKFEFYSSKGASIKYDFQICKLLSQIMMADGEKNFDNIYALADGSFDKLKISKKSIGDLISESENFLLNAKPCTAGDFPVVLSPLSTGVFAHESFGHKSEADFMLGDATMKKEWKIGKKIGKKLLNIFDTGTIEGDGYVPFDDEGTKARMNYLVKDGKLSGRLHSAATAADLNEGLTGNARAINADFEPIVRMTSTAIGAGRSSFKSLIRPIKFGYFIKMLKHGSGMSTFTLAPLTAYEIVDGKLGDPVKIGVATGNVFETLGLVDGLSANVEFAKSGGGCGKMEQAPLNVGMGGPYIRVSKMHIQ